MPTKFILSFLRVAVTILFYFMILVAVVILINSVSKIAFNNGPVTEFTGSQYDYKIKTINKDDVPQTFTYATDSIVRYKSVTDQFTLQIKYGSAMSYYVLIMKMIYLSLGTGVLWNFKKIFQETKLENPFQYRIIRRLKVLAVLFIVSDVLKLLDYFLFNSLLRQAIASPKFQLISDTGNDIITGLIIWIIAVIYQRGIALQEENALTV